LDVLTRSSSEPNRRAPWSVAFGLIALAVVPAAYAAAHYLERVTLIQGAAAMPAAGLFGIGAMLLGRRARREVERTLGRVGGGRTARIGYALGVLGLCIGVTAALALGFYGLLTLFASD
jgi:hypothetical protein